MFQITYSSRTGEQFAFSPPGIGGNPKLKEGYREINGCSNRSRQAAMTSFGWVIDRNGAAGGSNPNKGSESLEKSQIITIRGYPDGVQQLNRIRTQYGEPLKSRPKAFPWKSP
jgi:hypothetical protein